MNASEDPAPVKVPAAPAPLVRQDVYADANDAVREVLFRFTLGLHREPTPPGGTST